MTSYSRVNYLRHVLFPRAAAEGAFGPDAAFESFSVDDESASADQFASDILFGTVGLRGASDGRRRVVIKFKNADPVMSTMMNMHQKFYNEYVFYARLLPELARRAADPAAALAMFPPFIYSNATPDGRDGGGQEQVIVVGSLTPDGYRMSDSRVFLDADHATLAFRKLGALHGLSYAAKAHPDGRRTLVELAASLAETQWYDGHWFKSPRFLAGTGYRGVNALCDSEAGAEYAGRLERMRSMLDGNSETMARILRPVEPLAVLCHGDYCRNNLLFRYDPDTGRPADAVVFDPAQARYASPAVDLSFLLYMNIAPADRLARWDDYVDAYLRGLADVTPTGSPAAVSAADVHSEMRAAGLYGYAHCSFFLPAMVDTRPPDVQRLTTCTADERVDMINESGGPEADALLSSIVRHMVDRKYV